MTHGSSSYPSPFQRSNIIWQRKYLAKAIIAQLLLQHRVRSHAGLLHNCEVRRMQIATGRFYLEATPMAFDRSGPRAGTRCFRIATTEVTSKDRAVIGTWVAFNASLSEENDSREYSCFLIFDPVLQAVNLPMSVQTVQLTGQLDQLNYSFSRFLQKTRIIAVLRLLPQSALIASAKQKDLI